jgi:hypothetical protein
MEEDNCAQNALDVMADLLKERGYEYSYAPELEGTSLFYIDKAGNYHECWRAGSSELVNVPITVTPEQALSVDDLNGIIDENAKLRGQMKQLVTLLRVDWDIDASWDGLRRFWYIGLTNDGCLMRDRACKAEAENTKLRETLQRRSRQFERMTEIWVERGVENAKLRELARRFGEYVSQDRCEGCVMKRRCNNGDVEECWQMTEIRALANELGVEVEG